MTQQPKAQQTTQQIVVLGAGVVGVTTAYQLRLAGFDVVVIERKSAPAMQTSFANGGQISVSHATPWANPRTPLKALRWLWQEDAPLLFRWRRLFGRDFDKDLWQWSLQFLWQCQARQADKNLVQMVKLGLYSREILGQVRKQTGIEYDCLTRGILHFYTDQSELQHAILPTKRMQQLGCDRQQISVDQAIGYEPALQNIQHKLVGATYTALDESGDAKVFTQKLAKICQQMGVDFLFNHQIEQLCLTKQQITGVTVTDLLNNTKKTLTFDKYVLTMASYSPKLVYPLGIKLPIYPAKGYSATYPVRDPNKTPYVSLIDDEFKLVYSRLGDRLRVAGTAEFNGFDLSLNPVRCQAITRRVAEVFGDAVDILQPNYWTGLRPMTPSNVPLIGRAVAKRQRIDNLYLNTGHGTLGWTHANGSAKAIGDIVQGKLPDIEFNFIGLDV
ncbi:D-amino acid dehydrogenase subunit [Moraxella macacae 0408225]|uniref:D-amino acid dehydrogenase subunit n=1 Tax=Moraxella macacae 0408225 TaxID=1230338 RepID=L2F8H3_9GAMM|nr:D-amino acid dehydrogenase [Moraxella macacae]ELA09374.1 D-amino acid dehydrogenase subunit [Moraxella macacae 0408225]